MNEPRKTIAELRELAAEQNRLWAARESMIWDEWLFLLLSGSTPLPDYQAFRQERLTAQAG